MHYSRAQSQGHHTIGRLEERGMGRGSAQRSSLKRQGQDDHWNCFKGNEEETFERRGGGHMGISARAGTILNSTHKRF